MWTATRSARALQEFAKRVAKVLRATDVLARLGDDEFAVLAHGHRDRGCGEGPGGQDRRKPDAPMTDPQLVLRTRIGLSMYDCQRGASSVLREADSSVYRQKRADLTV